MFFETINITDGKIQNILYHNSRVYTTIKEYYNIETKINLQDLISCNKTGLIRCKIIYDKNIKSIQYYPYTPKNQKVFKIVSSNIDYKYKYTNRDDLNKLKKDENEIIIIKNNIITDTSIANIAIYLEDKWYTPTHPLLKGTSRARLLDKQKIFTKEITLEDLQKTKKFAIMNAMIGFKEISEFEIIL